MDREAQTQLPSPQLHASGQPASRAARANGHGVKTPMIYSPMEVELEAPEPPPHNASADLHWAAEEDEGQLLPLHDASTLADAGAGGRTGLGIMRVSSTPPQSKLHVHSAPTLKPRPQKGDKQWPAVTRAPSATPAMASGAVAPSVSYSAALKKSNPLLSAAVQAAIDSGSADASLPYARDLPPERFAGNIEYKWKLVAKSANRLVHLTTQLAYRLSEGAGECLYELGVQDDGYAQGLPAHELDQSIQCVLDMARSLGAEGTVIQRAWGREGVVAEVRVRRVGEVGIGPGLSAAADGAAHPVHADGADARNDAHDRVDEHKVGVSSSPLASAPSGGALASPSTTGSTAPSASPHSQSSVPCPCVTSGSVASTSGALYPSSCDLRLALVGGSSGGKSSLLGVLVSNQRDDGRGRARLHVVRHRHEVERGRSSAIARQVLGFDAHGQIINYTLHHTQTLGSAAVPPPAASSFLSSPGTGPIRSPPLASPSYDVSGAAKKKDKGLSSLFGGGDSSSGEDDSESDSESDSDDESICDFGFECAPDPLLAGGGGGVDASSTGVGSFGSSSGEELEGVGGACSTNDWQRIMEKSHKVYTIFDMPGHVDSSRTTIYGLIGTSCPDYCCIVVSCTNGNTAAESAVTTAAAAAAVSDDVAQSAVALPSAAPCPPPCPSCPPLISSLTREQILICAALHIPFLLLLCKADLAGAHEREKIARELHHLCAQIVAPDPYGDCSAPAGSRVVSHKIPVLLTPVGSDLAPEAAAEAAAHLDACMDLLERNQMGGIGEADVPSLLRASIVRAAASASVGSSSTDSTTATAPLWFPQHTFAPLLLLSNVTGEGMSLFKRYLHRLHNWRRAFWDSNIRRTVVMPAIATAAADATDEESPSPANLTLAAPASTAVTAWESVGAEFSIDEIFSVDSVGSVVSGTILAGVIHEGDTLLLGPLPDAASASVSSDAGVIPLPALPSSWPSWCCSSSFRPVVVKSLHLSRKSFKNARAGQSATLALRKIDRAWLRRGMVLLAVPREVMASGVPRPMPTLGMAQPHMQQQPSAQRSAWPRCCVGFEALIRLFDPVSLSSGRTLREAQTGGGSASGSSLNRRRAQAALVSPGVADASGVNGSVASGVSGGRSSPLSFPLSLRGQPIIHVGNVRQGGEVVSLRPVRLKSPRSIQRVHEWMGDMRRLVASRDVDGPHQPGQDLASLIDALERQEEEEESSGTTGAGGVSSDTLSVPVLSAPDRDAPLAQCRYALVRFEFLYQAEYLRLGRSVLFRDDRTRGTGQITDLCFVDEEEENATAEAAPAATAAQLPLRKRSSPQLRERQPSDSKTPSPSSGSSGGSGGSGRKRISSPPLHSPSPPATLSAFARTKERRALARKAEAASLAAAAAAPSAAPLSHSQSHWTLSQSRVQSQSQRVSICAGAGGAGSSPLVGPHPSHAYASLGCTPLLSATTPWPSAPALTDELQLSEPAVVSSGSPPVAVEARE